MAGGIAKSRPAQLPGEKLLIDLFQQVSSNHEPLITKEDLETGGSRFMPATSISVAPFKTNERLSEISKLEESKEANSSPARNSTNNDKLYAFFSTPNFYKALT